VFDTLVPLEKRVRAGEKPDEGGLDDLLVSWGEWSESPASVAALGQTTSGLEERLAALEAQVLAALPKGSRPEFVELLALHRQRAEEWGYSGVEFARQALVALLQ
jgi:hypothetical protein